MKQFFFSLIFSLIIIPAWGDSDSTSGSCSDTIPKYGYFYAYTYQYAYFYNGVLENESHSFSFSGFLDDDNMDKATIASYNDKHVIYESANYYLAVPYRNGENLYFKDKKAGIPGPGERNQCAENKWIKLCDY